MRVRSFFSNIQSQLVERNKRDPLGRYLAMCLQEAMRENRKLANWVVPGLRSAGPIDIRREYRYSASNSRRADLAIQDRVQEDVLALIEIKVEDSLTKGQAWDYREYARRTGCPLVVISRWPLTVKERSLLGNSRPREISTNDLCHAAQMLRGPNFPVTALLATYLEENEMVYTRFVDDSLALLVSRVCVGTDQNVRVKLEDVASALPEALSATFSTLQFLGNALRTHVKFPKSHSRSWTNVTLNMEFYPETSFSAAENLLARAKKEEWPGVWLAGLDRKSRRGEAVFYGSLQVSDTTDQAYLVFGLKLSVAKSRPATLKLYTWISYDPENVSEREKTLKLNRSRGAWDLGEEQRTLETLVDMLRESKTAYEKYYARQSADRFPAQVKRVKILEKVKVV